MISYVYGITEYDRILFRIGGPDGIERYDQESKTWVVDFTLLGVYSDDIPSVVLSEEEAKERISGPSA